jgi:hypothetical protein
MRTRVVGTVLVVLSVHAGVAQSAALTRAERCRVGKLAAVGVAVAASLRCVARAVREHASAVDASCLATADERLARAFARVEARNAGPCAPDLAAARADVAALVNAQASVVLATPTPAPSATPGPTGVASPGCGNGIVEAGEKCDGASYCDPSCNFAFPRGCCAIANVCTTIPDIATGDQCFLAGGMPSLGSDCGEPPPCPVGEVCGGGCTPRTFPPTTFCCDLGATCTESTLSDAQSLASLLLSECGVGGLVQGTCDVDHCVPGG